VGTNDSTGSLGPRSEITAHRGTWERCGSVFDTNCDGIQNSVPGFSGAADPRRLGVLESDLQVPGATYYFDSWYVVRDDNNIYNGMAYRQVTPTFTGTAWTFGPLSAQRAGAVVDAWVNPAAPGPNADNRKIDTGVGQLTLAGRATDVGGGRWRYDYALMNHDYDNGISTFSVALPAGAVVSNAFFRDHDRNPETDWVAKVAAGDQIRFEPPKNARTPHRYFQDWGLLYTFSFEVNAAPAAIGDSSASLGVLDGLTRSLSVRTVGPIK
jgi:hypothetical protein